MIKLVQLNEDLEHLEDELKDKVVVALDDTQADVALDHDNKLAEVDRETKEVIDSTKDLAKKTNADGEIRKITEAVEEEQTPEEFGINGAIANLIKSAWDNIDTANSYLATFEDAPESLKNALNLIIDDNMIHIGQLESIFPGYEQKQEEDELVLK